MSNDNILFIGYTEETLLFKTILANFSYTLIQIDETDNEKNLVLDYHPIAIIIDLNKMGYEEKKKIISRYIDNRLLTLVITADESKDDIIELLNLGVFDIINRPINDMDIIQKLYTAKKMNSLIDENTKCKIKLQECYSIIEKLSEIDGITGVGNKRAFEKNIEREVKRGKREKINTSIILFNIVNFKLYNESYGYGEGDKCLNAIARILQSLLRRPGDFLYRYTQDTFAAILSNTDNNGALNQAEAIENKIREMKIENRNSENRIITLKTGVITIDPECEEEKWKNISIL